MVWIYFGICIWLFTGHIQAAADKKCQSLLQYGKFQHKDWRPDACDMYTYTQREFRQCLLQRSMLKKEENLLVFVGDYNMRQRFSAIKNFLVNHYADQGSIWHQQIDFKDDSIKTRMEYHRADSTTHAMAFMKNWKTRYTDMKPNFIMIGTHFDTSGNMEDKEHLMLSYKGNVSDIRDNLQLHMSNGESVWSLEGDNDVDSEANTVLKSSSVYVEQSLSTKSQSLSRADLNILSQILANLLCNKVLDVGQPKACCRGEGEICCKVDGTGSCCAELPLLSVDQVALYHQDITLTIFFCVVLLTIFLKVILYIYGGGENKTLWKKVEIVTTIVTTLCIMMYVFICDRSGIVSKDSKPFRPIWFGTALIICACLTVISLKKFEKDDILNRDQTDEWKGWMQLIILIYHYTGASKNLMIYSHVRLLVSSYFFMTGFGHTCYYLKYRKITFKRGLQVMFRMNFLVICLCITMYKHYQFYYFVPLVSFWYAVVFAICYVTQLITVELIDILSQVQPADVDGDIDKFYWFQCLCHTEYDEDTGEEKPFKCEQDGEQGRHVKVFTMVLASTITLVALLYQFKHESRLLCHCFSLCGLTPVFDFIFSMPPISFILAPTDSYLHEWWFRSSTDRYSCLYGMVAGLALFLIKAETLQSHKGTLIPAVIGLNAIFALLSLAFYVGRLCINKPECNAIHPYMTVVPILGFICIRNIHSTVRKYNSMFLCWFGKISLELFLCQYHIWLASGSKDLLIFIPEHPLINCICTSVIFVLVAHQTQHVTNNWSNYIFT